MRRGSNIKEIISIKKFKLDPEEVVQLYPRAYALPAFFSHNLLSPRRIVKYFQGGLALVGAFYYQLMKLALELQPEDINYRDLVFKKFVQFDVFGQGELEDDLFTDFQYRKFFKDFIEIVERQDVPDFEKTAEIYPIIDQILMKYFHKIIPMPMLMELQHAAGRSKDVAREILCFLCEQFQITLTEIGPCFKLEESDTFIYFQNIQEVFLAYNEITVETAEQEETEFTSTFECGIGNSFLTKYHAETIKSQQKVKKKEESQKNSIILLQTKENVVKLQTSCQVNIYSGFITTDNTFLTDKFNKMKSQGKFLTQTREKVSQPFQQISALLNRDLKKNYPTLAKPIGTLYSEFTDSLILKQMPTFYRDGIKSIKDKYKRSSIRNFI